MQAETAQAPVPVPDGRPPVETPPAPRLWFPIALVILFWLLCVVVGSVDKPYFFGFLYSMGSAAVFVLLFFGWWWTNRRIRLADRAFGFLAVVIAGAIIGSFCDKSVRWFGLLTGGLPMVLSVWTFWMWLMKRLAVSSHRLAWVVVVCLSWGVWTLIRVHGVNADLKADIHWRWTSSAEELFLAQERSSEQTGLSNWTASVSPGDWPEFRGPNRDGVIVGAKIATDWNAAPPRALWRQRVGPAWSSMIIVNGRLFTQEQRGTKETVVCYDASSGKELWVHEDSARFEETVSRTGPRATPTFAAGRIYTLGATGILNCLDATTGNKQWARDLLAEASAQQPLWGFSSSPLVIEGLVIVYAGGEGEKGLLAYRAESGQPAWSTKAGKTSYSSAQLATMGGKQQLLFISDHGIAGLEPSTGKELWNHGIAWEGAPRCSQPHVINDTQILAASVDGFGLSLIELVAEGDNPKAKLNWFTTTLKTEFPDFVVHQGHIYGFDVAMFCCIDLGDGKRRWKGGRYGRGQVMLLKGQSLLLVTSEKGEAILLSANPDKHEELGRFQAVQGTTWQHPVIARGRLYVRNAEEMACYDVRMRE